MIIIELDHARIGQLNEIKIAGSGILLYKLCSFCLNKLQLLYYLTVLFLKKLHLQKTMSAHSAHLVYNQAAVQAKFAAFQ